MRIIRSKGGRVIRERFLSFFIAINQLHPIASSNRQKQKTLQDTPQQRTRHAPLPCFLLNNSPSAKTIQKAIKKTSQNLLKTVDDFGEHL
jgi:hypothetical protein